MPVNASNCLRISFSTTDRQDIQAGSDARCWLVGEDDDVTGGRGHVLRTPRMSRLPPIVIPICVAPAAVPYWRLITPSLALSICMVSPDGGHMAFQSAMSPCWSPSTDGRHWHPPYSGRPPWYPPTFSKHHWIANTNRQTDINNIYNKRSK